VMSVVLTEWFVLLRYRKDDTNNIIVVIVFC
jgi:hypothetical protein